MTSSRFVGICSTLLVLSLPGNGPLHAQQQPSKIAAERDRVVSIGAFLTGATSKTLSLRRTSKFLDVDRIDRQLQVAILIDGTESMEAELQSLQQNLRAFVRSLQQVKQDPIPTVAVAIVVYRDTDSPSGPVESVIGRFENDLNVVERELTAVRPQSGAPYFREAVDQGLHHVLTKLDWLPTSEPGISRWIIVAGDAPPYPEGSMFRKYSDQELTDLALEKQIAIYGMATGSGFLQIGADETALRATAEKERPHFRNFLGNLAQATGGHTVDTLDADAVRYWMTSKQEMQPITAADIDAVRKQGQPQAAVGKLRIAVLPHLPLNAISFESGRAEVVVATHLRDRLSRLGGIDVVPAAEVQQAFAKLKLVAGDSLAKLAPELHADYIVWGSQRINLDLLVVETGLFKGLDGTQLASVTESTKPVSDEGRLMIVNTLFRQLCAESAQELARRMNLAHAKVFDRTSSDPKREQQLMAPLANDHRAQSAILAGLDQLEQSLAYVKTEEAEGDPAVPYLQSAIQHLEVALSIEPDAPYAHLLLADCYHNLSRRQLSTDEAAKVAEHLDRAHRDLHKLPSTADPVQLEIEAQYALLVVKDVEAAIRHYRELAGRTVGMGGRFNLRSHWMLAGIHMGDWDAISYGWDHVDPNQAREHILTILAYWPESPEARFYERCIRDSVGESLEVPVGDAQLAQTY